MAKKNLANQANRKGSKNIMLVFQNTTGGIAILPEYSLALRVLSLPAYVCLSLCPCGVVCVCVRQI